MTASQNVASRTAGRQTGAAIQRWCEVATALSGAITQHVQLQNHRVMDQAVQESEDGTLAALNALLAVIDYLQQRGFNRSRPMRSAVLRSICS
jgi:hypothetical protein